MTFTLFHIFQSYPGITSLILVISFFADYLGFIHLVIPDLPDKENHICILLILQRWSKYNCIDTSVVLSLST